MLKFSGFRCTVSRSPGLTNMYSPECRIPNIYRNFEVDLPIGFVPRGIPKSPAKA